jgi:hypothetical protein
MKNVIAALLLLISTSLFAQKTYHFGISFGTVGNSSSFASGMEEANALFDQADHGAGLISFTFEKDICERFSVETGLSFTELGFTYSLRKNYSLKRPSEKGEQLMAGNCIGQLPLFFNYRTKLNCSNNRWIIGIGPQLMYATESFDKSSSTELTREGVKTGEELSQHSVMASFAAVSLAGHAGIEHVFKKGSKLRWSVIINHGFSELGYSTVNYTVNNTAYTHTFSNSGSYAGCAVSWFFR